MSTSVWSLALYGSETWTLKAEDKRRIQSFEMTAYRRMLRVSWMEHRTNASMLQEVQPPERLLTTVQRRKLQYFARVVRARNLCTEMLEGRIERKRKPGRPRRRWTDDVKDLTSRTAAESSQLPRQAAVEHVVA